MPDADDTAGQHVKCNGRNVRTNMLNDMLHNFCVAFKCNGSCVTVGRTWLQLQQMNLTGAWEPLFNRGVKVKSQVLSLIFTRPLEIVLSVKQYKAEGTCKW